MKERNIRRLFELTLLLKAADSLLEIASGAVLLIAGRQAISGIAVLLTRGELLEDPNDRVANYILHLAQNLSIADQSFAGFYLLTHGIVKLFLVSAVMLGKRWAYPLFMAALVLLIVYQSYQLTLGLSATLIFLTVLDLAVLGLTWHEYRLVMRGM